MPEDCVQCLIIDPSLKKRWGERLPFRISVARRMEREGKVKIIDPEEEKQTPTRSVPVISQHGTQQGVHVFSRNQYRQYSTWPRVAWVQDFSKYGGAEYSNLYMIRIGEQLGFDIIGVTPKTFIRKFIRDAEVVIVNNVFEFDEKQLNELYWELFEHKLKFIKYDHDMRELRRLPKTRCLFERSVFNVFLSPAHRAEYQKEHIDGICLPLAVDTGYWRNIRAERKPNTCIIPTYHKGPENHDRLIAQHKDWQFTVIGRTLPPKRGNVTLLNNVAPDKLRELYNKHEHMAHLPKVLWAGERVYLEAALCGCKTIINDMVGHSSYGFKPEQIKAECMTAPYKFWKEVEEIL